MRTGSTRPATTSTAVPPRVRSPSAHRVASGRKTTGGEEVAHEDHPVDVPVTRDELGDTDHRLGEEPELEERGEPEQEPAGGSIERHVDRRDGREEEGDHDQDGLQWVDHRSGSYGWHGV